MKIEHRLTIVQENEHLDGAAIGSRLAAAGEAIIEEFPVTWIVEVVDPSDDSAFAVYRSAMNKRLQIEVRRRVEASQDRAEALTQLAYSRAERDAALKQLRDSYPGVAKVLAQVQEQGCVIEALHDQIAELRATFEGGAS